MAEANPKKPDDTPPREGGGSLPPAPANDDSDKPRPAATAAPVATPVEAPKLEASLKSAQTLYVDVTKATMLPSFRAAAFLAEKGEASAFPRVENQAEETKPVEKKETGVAKYMRLVGLGDIVDAARQRERKGHHITQAILDKIGFGDIYKEAKKPGQKRFRKMIGVSKAVGKKTADMIAGRFVSSSFRLIAITFVAGMIGGVSGWGSIFLLGLATGAASSIYTYGKEYIGDRFWGSKEERKNIKLFERKRFESAAKAFGSGTFNGIMGAWLAGLPIFQSFMKFLHGLIDEGIGQISKPLAKPFNEVAAPKFTAPGESLIPHFMQGAGKLTAGPLPQFTPVWTGTGKFKLAPGF